MNGNPAFRYQFCFASSTHACGKISFQLCLKRLDCFGVAFASQSQRDKSLLADSLIVKETLAALLMRVS